EKPATGDEKSDETSNAQKSPPEAEKSDKKPDGETLLGDMGGLRPFLVGYGAKLAIVETSEVLGNFTGGLRRGARYEGVTDLSLRIDLRPSLHLRGEIFARAYQIHGRGLTADNLGNLNIASSIEAARTTRLNELWYEQHFDNWRLRLGQQTIGTEFYNPDSARLFVNAT